MFEITHEIENLNKKFVFPIKVPLLIFFTSGCLKLA